MKLKKERPISAWLESESLATGNSKPGNNNIWIPGSKRGNMKKGIWGREYEKRGMRREGEGRSHSITQKKRLGSYSCRNTRKWIKVFYYYFTSYKTRKRRNKKKFFRPSRWYSFSENFLCQCNREISIHGRYLTTRRIMRHRIKRS